MMPTNPPISAWLFDDGTGTNAADSFSANHGELLNFSAAPWATNRPSAPSFNYATNRSLFFDGDNDFVNAGIADNLNFHQQVTSFTFSAWVYNTGVITGQETILSKYGGGSDQEYNWWLDAGGGEIRTEIRETTDNGDFSSTRGFPGIGTNGWVHLAMVFNLTNGNDTLIDYRGGTNNTTFVLNIVSTINNANDALTIGNRTANGDFEFGGYLDEIAIFDYALVSGANLVDRRLIAFACGQILRDIDVPELSGEILGQFLVAKLMPQGRSISIGLEHVLDFPAIGPFRAV